MRTRAHDFSLPPKDDRNLLSRNFTKLYIPSTHHYYCYYPHDQIPYCYTRTYLNILVIERSGEEGFEWLTSPLRGINSSQKDISNAIISVLILIYLVHSMQYVILV